ncbi:hypothetical protein D3C84_600940 [compost metagenome]
MIDQRPVELRLAVFVETDRGVQLGDVLARQDALEEADELRRHRHIDHEIRTGEREDDRHVRFVGDQRIDLNAATFEVQQRNRQRPLLVGGVDAPHQVRAFIAVEHRGKQFDAQLRVLAHPVRQVLAQLRFQARQVTGQVGVILAETVIGKDAREHAGQLTLGFVSAGLRSAGPTQARPGGVDEHAAVADQVVAEQPAEDRVVPGLGQFIVEAQVDQADVGAFDQRPAADIQRIGVERDAQPVHRFADFIFVEVDPRRRGDLRFLPLGLLETRPGAIGDLPEMLAVIVKAIEDHSGDVGGWPLLRHGETSTGIRKA